MPAISEAAGDGSDPCAAAEPPERLLLEIVHESGDWGWLAEAEAAAMEAAAALARHPALTFTAASACVALSSADAVRRLNRDYRQKDTATNVLSFPATDTAGRLEDGREMLGDVVLAAEVVRAEADDAGIAPKHHFQHLVVHGLLHLIGYDHEQDDEAAVMEGLEVEILHALGIADPYAQAA